MNAPPQPKHRRIVVLILLGLTILLAGCVTLTDTEASQEQRQAVIARLGPGDNFRQGFVSPRAGLNRVVLWLRAPDDSPTGGTVKLALHRTSGQPQLLAELEAPLEALRQNEQVTLSLPPLQSSSQNRYEIQLTMESGEVEVLGKGEDVYPAGEAVLGDELLLADAAFQISYEYGANSVLEDFARLTRLSWLVLPLGVVLFLPGWLLAGAFLPIWNGTQRGKNCCNPDFGTRTALYLGLSLAVIPVVMTWTSLLGLSWSRWSAAAAFGFLAALAVYRLWVGGTLRLQQIKHRAAMTGELLAARLRSGPSINYCLLAVFLVSLFVRAAMVRDISAPPWVDSVHHALTTRLILENGTYPQSYTPYLDIEPSGYHPGFHSVLAAFLWLSGIDLVDGMLLFGQALNALMIFPTYLFAVLLTRRRLAGLLAALACGLITPMPAYYTSWGRYTQLAGLAILPAALLLVQLASERRDWKKNVLAAALLGVVLGGLFLTHFRVAAFLACLLIAMALVEAVRRIWSRVFPRGVIGFFPHSRQDLATSLLNRQSLLLLGAAVLLAVGLALPVLAPALTGLLAPKLSAWRPAVPDRFEGVTWPYVNTAWGEVTLVLAALGLAWSLARGRFYGLVLILWVGLLFFIANLGAVGLPGSGFVNAISVTISLFLPLTVLSGDILAETAQAWRSALPWRYRPIYRWSLAAGTLLAVVFSSRSLIGLLNPVTFLYRSADRPALQWMAENLPAGETVLVNPFAWGYGQYAGNDGGYWANALAGLPTMPPPVLYGLSNSQEYIEHINLISQQVIDRGSDPAALHDLMVNEGIQYVYIGARGGVISASALRSSPLFAPRYAGKGTFVFQALQP